MLTGNGGYRAQITQGKKLLHHNEKKIKRRLVTCHLGYFTELLTLQNLYFWKFFTSQAVIWFIGFQREALSDT